MYGTHTKFDLTKPVNKWGLLKLHVLLLFDRLCS